MNSFGRSARWSGDSSNVYFVGTNSQEFRDRSELIQVSAEITGRMRDKSEPGALQTAPLTRRRTDMSANIYRSSLSSQKKGECESCACPECGGLECLCRPRFFAGQLLTDQTLNDLDRYIIEKNKLHNRYLHGWGVVCGLEAVCAPATRSRSEAVMH